MVTIYVTYVTSVMYATAPCLPIVARNSQPLQKFSSLALHEARAACGQSVSRKVVDNSYSGLGVIARRCKLLVDMPSQVLPCGVAYFVAL